MKNTICQEIRLLIKPVHYFSCKVINKSIPCLLLSGLISTKAQFRTKFVSTLASSTNACQESNRANQFISGPVRLYVSAQPLLRRVGGGGLIKGCTKTNAFILYLTQIRDALEPMLCFNMKLGLLNKITKVYQRSVSCELSLELIELTVTQLN